MLVDIILQDYTYFVFLFFVGLLGFSAGLCAPRKRRAAQHQVETCCNALNRQREVAGNHYIESKQFESSIRGRLKDSTPAGDREIEEAHSMNAKEVFERREEVEQESKLKSANRAPKPLAERPLWLRSLSRGGQRKEMKTVSFERSEGHEGKKQGASGGGGSSGGVERKPSLTGEEVKELSDAFIARMRQRLRLQRQESYEARLDRSS